jgi:O-antigen/teichoic acid export membrane protein
MMSGLAKDSAITFAVRSLVMILSILDSVIIARILGPSLNGSYRIILLIINAASLSFLFGLGAANVYFGAREPEKLPTLTGNSYVAAFGFGLIGALAIELLTLVPAFQVYLAENGVDVHWIRMLILLLPLAQLRVYLAEIVRAKGDIVRYNLVAGLHIAASLAGTIILVWFLRQGLGGALRAWAISLVVAALLAIRLASRATGVLPKVDLSSLRRSFTFGLRVGLANIAQFLNFRLDVFLVGFFLAPAAVGFYTAAVALAEIMWGIPNAIRTVLLYQVAATDRNTAAMMTARVNRIVNVLMGGICILLILVSYPLVRMLYGNAYLPAAPALIALMPGIWAFSIGKLLTTHLVASGRPGAATTGAAISLIATVALDFILIPELGIVGAAIASSVSYSLSAMVILVIFLRTTGLRLANVALINREDISALRPVLDEMWRQYGSRFAMQFQRKTEVP